MPSMLQLLHSKLALANCHGKHGIRIRLVLFLIGLLRTPASAAQLCHFHTEIESRNAFV